jgi:hypothetical protein
MAEISANSVKSNHFVKGFDPRRVINPPNNKGKKYETRKKLLRRYLELNSGEHEGEPVNQLERIIVRRIQAALGERTVTVEGQPMTMPVETSEERFAAQYILDALFGKPAQTVNANLSGQIQHTHIAGKSGLEMSDEEFEEAKRLVAERTHKWKNDMLLPIDEAEYAVIENGTGESEPEMPLNAIS